MLKAGFSQNQLDRQKSELRKDLFDRFGSGKVHAPERKTFVDGLSLSARRIINKSQDSK